MKPSNNLSSITEVKNIDIVNYLSSLDFKPAKIVRNDFWYLSPFRDESIPSFKVNRNMNRWYDFGEGKGGTIIDFGILYHHCSVGEFLKKMNRSFSFQQQTNQTKQTEDESKKIKVLNAKEISSLVLIRYLHTRRIPLDVASKFCKEIDYELYGRQYYAIGFKNNAGGYELRNEKFKASSSPKDVTIVKNNADKISVFEGFFNFLSYQAIHQRLESSNTDFLILNSASFFDKSLPVMESYKSTHLYLDCDATGEKCIQKAMAIDSKKFFDERGLYKNYKDLNDWIMYVGHRQKQGICLKP